MTITFNPDKYKELLITYLPKLIKTEAENEQALAIVEELMYQTRTPEEDEVYQLLITLVEKFEQENYPLNQAQNPLSMLLFLLDQSHKSRNDLILLLGSEDIVTQILNGQEKINPEQASKLGAFFHVKSNLFLE